MDSHHSISKLGRSVEVDTPSAKHPVRICTYNRTSEDSASPHTRATAALTSRGKMGNTHLPPASHSSPETKTARGRLTPELLIWGLVEIDTQLNSVTRLGCPRLRHLVNLFTSQVPGDEAEVLCSRGCRPHLRTPDEASSKPNPELTVASRTRNSPTHRAGGSVHAPSQTQPAGRRPSPPTLAIPQPDPDSGTSLPSSHPVKASSPLSFFQS